MCSETVLLDYMKTNPYRFHYMCIPLVKHGVFSRGGVLVSSREMDGAESRVILAENTVRSSTKLVTGVELYLL